MNKQYGKYDEFMDEEIKTDIEGGDGWKEFEKQDEESNTSQKKSEKMREKILRGMRMTHILPILLIILLSNFLKVIMNSTGLVDENPKYLEWDALQDYISGKAKIMDLLNEPDEKKSIIELQTKNNLSNK